MWQRIRDYSSAVNFSILNFLRRRNYEQFDESEEDSFVNNSSGVNETQTEKQTLDCSAAHTDTCAIIDHIEVHDYHDTPKSYSAITQSINNNDSDSDSRPDQYYRHQHQKQDEIVRDYMDADQGRDLVPRDVKDVVQSYSQKRYKKLEDESSDDEDFQITLAEETSPVFHSAKDFKRKKSNKKGRRKKIAKVTRRSIRGSWKWFKRGVMGYAGGLATANIFMFIYSKQ